MFTLIDIITAVGWCTMNNARSFSFKQPGLSLYRKVLGLALIVLCLGGIGTGFALLQNSVLTTVEDMSRAQTALAHASRCELAFIGERKDRKSVV